MVDNAITVNTAAIVLKHAVAMRTNQPGTRITSLHDEYTGHALHTSARVLCVRPETSNSIAVHTETFPLAGITPVVNNMGPHLGQYLLQSRQPCTCVNVAVYMCPNT